MSVKSKKTKLWKIVSEYVRRRDADSQGYTFCYTCGVVGHWKEMDAGHGIAGRKNMVLFDLEILRPQCKMCNGFKGGMHYIFGKRLDEENGEGFYEKKLENAWKPRKFAESELDDMIEDIKERLSKL